MEKENTKPEGIRKEVRFFQLSETEIARATRGFQFQLVGTEILQSQDSEQKLNPVDLSNSPAFAACLDDLHIENTAEHCRGVLSITPAKPLSHHGHSAIDKWTQQDDGKGYVLVATGSFKADLQPLTECVRCLSEFRNKIKIDESFRVIKYSASRAQSEASSQELEFDSDLLDAFPLDQGKVQLDEILQELIEAALPDYPLCEPNCRGLCVVCGNNMNHPAACDRTDCAAVCTDLQI